jgi:hypothetical protein
LLRILPHLRFLFFSILVPYSLSPLLRVLFQPSFVSYITIVSYLFHSFRILFIVVSYSFHPCFVSFYIPVSYPISSLFRILFH